MTHMPEFGPAFGSPGASSGCSRFGIGRNAGWRSVGCERGRTQSGHFGREFHEQEDDEFRIAMYNVLSLLASQCLLTNGESFESGTG